MRGGILPIDWLNGGIEAATSSHEAGGTHHVSAVFQTEERGITGAEVPLRHEARNPGPDTKGGKAPHGRRGGDFVTP